MDEILDALAENAAAFDEIDSSIAATIGDGLDGTDFDQLKTALTDVVNAVATVQDDIRNNDAVDDVYADGLDDGLGAVEQQLDLAAGQLSVSARVIKAGAGPAKAAEYIENAAEATGEAERHLTNLNEFVDDHADDPSDVDAAVSTAKERLAALQTALEAIDEDLS